MKKIITIYEAKKKPKWLEQKLWELWLSEGVRKLIAATLGRRFTPFSGEVLTEEPKEEAPATPKIGHRLKVPHSKAVSLLKALGKANAGSMSDAQLSSKLENIVNVAEAGTKLENASLQAFLDKLFDYYPKGIEVTIVRPEASAAA